MNETISSQRPAKRWKSLTVDDLDRKTVQQMLDEASERLSQGLQNVYEEYKEADILWCRATRSEAVEDDICRALETLRDRLDLRCMGHDLCAIHSVGSLGSSWFEEEA